MWFIYIFQIIFLQSYRTQFTSIQRPADISIVVALMPAFITHNLAKLAKCSGVPKDFGAVKANRSKSLRMSGAGWKIFDSIRPGIIVITRIPRSFRSAANGFVMAIANNEHITLVKLTPKTKQIDIDIYR